MNNEKFINNWKKKKQKGESIYLITSGIIFSIGLLLCSIMIIVVKYYLFHQQTKLYIYAQIEYLVDATVGGFMAGIMRALEKWYDNEKIYNQLVNNK